MNDFPVASIVIACRNEEKFIRKCLDSILAQDYPKDKLEILVVDGMSDDRTRKILNEYARRYENINVIDNPAKITPKAFNIGIKNSSGTVITTVSAHSTFFKNYISKCVEYLNKTGADNVGGAMRAVGTTYKSKAIAFVYNSPFGLGGGKAHNENFEGEVDGVYPGCWPRRIFEKVGLFNEYLVRNQDIEFDSRVRKSGGKIFLTPEIKVYYYCRSNLKGLWKQNFRNGLWNIKMVKISPGSLSLRHFVPFFFILGLLTSWIIKPIWFTVILSYILCNTLFSLKIAKKNGFKYLFIIPLIFLTLHLSYGLGSLVGIFSIIRKDN